MLAVALTATAGDAMSQECWTRFRGPNGTGVSMATTIPVSWTDDDLNWKIEIPGEGHSQPVFWEGKLFLTSAVENGNTRVVLCLDAKTGKTLWRKDYPSESHAKHKFNSFASATPTVDGDHVYVVYSTPQQYVVTALTHDGEEKWTANLGPYESQHSCGTSPILFEDMVIIGNEQDGASSIVALDSKTGTVRWQTGRRTAVTAYSTPMVYEPEGSAPQLIFNSQAHGISAVDARTGRPLWEAPVLTKRSCSSPILAGGHLIGSCGSGGGGNYLVAVRPGGSGDVSQTHLAYKIDRSAPYVPTPVTNGDLMFLWNDKGIVSCVDSTSGELLWQKRVGGNYFGSPIRVRDRIYCMSADGECVVLAATSEFRELARVPMGEGSHSTPSICDGRLYLRTFGHLLCVGGE